MNDAQHALDDLWEVWVRQVEDVRAAYVQAGIPDAQWKVSTGRGAPRSKSFEPDVATCIDLWVASGEAKVDRRVLEAQYARFASD